MAVVNVDGWLNLPHVRFSSSDPAGHFYRNALRFDEMFRDVIIPLRDRRSVHVVTDFAEERATAFRPQRWDLDGVDIVVLEGIFLLKRELRRHYDVAAWVECSQATALARAIARQQEGLSPESTVRAYRTIYFPAQAIHAERDDPRSAAAVTVDNDV